MAPGLVRQLRASEDYRHKLARDLDTWRRANPVHAAIDAYRAKAIERGRHTEADVSVSDGQVVSDLKLLDEAPGGDGSLTRAAVLMFHADPERFVVGATVKVAYYAPEGAYGQNKADDIIYQDEVRGPARAHRRDVR